MKKQICIVDNDPLSSAALKQALTTMSGAWECTFVSTADAALAKFAAQPFDAVVTKLNLGKTSGADLLREAGKLHPKAVRFVLGSVADQEMIMNGIGGTHQFISQSCEPPVLVSLIQRSLALDAWLSSDKLRALAPRLQRLPSLPSTYFEMLKLVESPNADMQGISEVIARDPAVTARLLQMVNSAAFALNQKITSPLDAVSLLGIETVKSLVLCLQVFAQNDQAKEAGLSFERLWEHSFSVATLAQAITMRQTRNARLANDAFTAGLLHDIGRIMLATNVSKEFAAALAAAKTSQRLLHEEEEAQLGVTHTQVGAYLLGLWGMPAPLVEAVALHHCPGQTPIKEFTLLTAVHAADVLAHESETQKDQLRQPTFDQSYLAALGLADKVETWRQLVAGGKSAPTTDPAPAAESAARPEPARTAPAAAPARGPNWLLRLLIPGAAVAVVAIALLWRAKKPNPADAITAAAKTADHPATTLMPPDSTNPVPAAAGNPTLPATRTPSAVPNPANPAGGPKTAPRAPRLGLGSIKIQGVFYSANNPSVMINGQALTRGEHINGVEIVEIQPSSVVVTFNGERKTFQVR